MVEVSIIIVCMDRPDILYPCLRSIIAHTTVSYEIIVTAYRFSEEHLRQARTDFPDVIWVESRETRGFAENNNLAIARASGKFCFILNDDTELHEDVIGALVKDFNMLPENTAAIGPRLLNTDGSLQLAGLPEMTAWRYVLERFHLYKPHKDDTAGRIPVTGSIYPTFGLCGAAFLIKTATLRSLGCLDERFFFTPEDIALCAKARKAGLGIYCDRSVSLVHKWHATASAISAATKPAAMRGTLIHLSDGSLCRYTLLAVPTFIAESAKLIFAFPGRNSSPEAALRFKIYKNNCTSIFTRRSPKDLFIRFSR
ncbi:MAG: glycosyltransferase [Bacteroidales bacterium]|nr:glycosyltransferase [Bacteroidales bacterium]